MHKRAGDLDEALVEITRRFRAHAQPEGFQHLMGLKVIATVETIEESLISRLGWLAGRRVVRAAMVHGHGKLEPLAGIVK